MASVVQDDKLDRFVFSSFLTLITSRKYAASFLISFLKNDHLFRVSDEALIYTTCCTLILKVRNGQLHHVKNKKITLVDF